MVKALVFDAYGTLYDTQSVTRVIDEAFPDRGEIISVVWRMKQLEYSWLRSMMGTYADFWTVTGEALDYTLKGLGLTPDEALFARLADAYNHLTPYPEAREALETLARDHKLAILSNGSPDMLRQLVHHSGFGGLFDRTISVDPKRVFKPDPRAYALIGETLDVAPAEVLFISSNGFDVHGAKSFGLKVARIARSGGGDLAREIATGAQGPATLFKALRGQDETHGEGADHVIGSLAELPGLVGAYPTHPFRSM
jgi:2-haloacid dehalogenase